jgi:hypothetical protein
VRFLGDQCQAMRRRSNPTNLHDDGRREFSALVLYSYTYACSDAISRGSNYGAIIENSTATSGRSARYVYIYAYSLYAA